MRPEAYQLLASRQRTYWWHRARRAMCAALLRRHGLPTGCRWLDIGCGPGGNLALLDPWRPELTVGVDLSPLALDFARQEAAGARLVRADITKGLPFADSSFDIATIFNVLYHDWVTSESDTLREMTRVLRPGGLAVITEPAFRSLSRELDKTVMGRRRYRLAEFRRLCRTAGLDVTRASYFGSFAAVLLLAVKGAAALATSLRAPRLATDIDMRPVAPVINEFLYWMARVEAFGIAMGLRVPLGTTLFCLVRKPA